MVAAMGLLHALLVLHVPPLIVAALPLLLDGKVGRTHACHPEGLQALPEVQAAT
jgi:hypothetical protein